MAVPFVELMRDLASRRPDAPAVTCGDISRTRSDLEERSNRLARAYAAVGVTAGDLVTIALPNGVEFVESMVAVWKLGAVPQPVSYRLPDLELAAIIDLAEPSLVVGAGGRHQRSVPTLAEGFEPPSDTSDAPIEGAPVSSAWKAPTSGGSTGRPKLIVAGAPAAIDPLPGLLYGMREDGVELVPGPLYHNAPFSFTTVGLLTGNHVVIMPKFDAVAALESIERFAVDWVNFVPTMMLRILRVLQVNPDAFDISSLSMVWHMAAPCPEWLKEAWIGLVGAERLMELYGGTESQALTTISGVEWLAHRGSVGRPILGEMKILDSDGAATPVGKVGEIFLRRPAGAEPTYRYIGAEARVVDGWESLGDLGWMDDDGYLYISDRRTDLILVGGANVYPAEVEAALMEHPMVDTAVVVGLPDDDLGQRVHALVHATGNVAEADLVAFLGERLVRYKVPRSFRLVSEPLRDDAGKVRRSQLLDKEAARLGDSATG